MPYVAYKVLPCVATAHFSSLVLHYMVIYISLCSLSLAGIPLATGHLHMLFPLSGMLLLPVVLIA